MNPFDVGRCISPALRARFCAPVLLALLGGASPHMFAASAADFQAGRVERVGSESTDLPYRWLVPAGYDPAKQYPLIIFLHGSGERGTDNTAQLGNNANGALQLVSDRNQAEFPAFMLAPQANPAQGWNETSLHQTYRAVQALEAKYSIDRDRIYVTGLSLGGLGTYSFAAMYADYVAAAAPMSAWMTSPGTKLAAMPIWAFHAADDATVSVTLGDFAVASIRAAGGRVVYTRYETGGHGIWPTAYGNPYLLPWLMSQRRHQLATGTPSVTITTPASRLPPLEPMPTLTAAGRADFPDAAFNLYWTFTPANVGSLVDPAVNAPLSGTTTWSISQAPVPSSAAYFMALARGPSWGDGFVNGGYTSANDTVWVIPPGANLAPPTVAITSPSGSGNWTTLEHTTDLAGTLSFAIDQPVQLVGWTSDRGGSGVALFDASSWTALGVALQDGVNVITVAAKTANGVAGLATLRVQAGALAPAISSQPQGAYLAAGGSARLAVAASGAAPLAYQWRKDGVALDGATAATLQVGSARASDAGSYSVVVSNSAGQIASDAATLVVTAGPTNGRLINLSARALAGRGDQTLIVGLTVNGAGDLPVLIRGIGPALAPPPFGLTEALTDPRLRLFRGSTAIAENDDWGGSAALANRFAAVGAFPLPAASKDAALYTTLSPGTNTAHVISQSNALGLALAEIYDGNPAAGGDAPRLSNLSARAPVDIGARVLIGGFVIGGPGPRTVLIRAVGPTLAQFQVGGVLADPRLELHSAKALLLTNDDWSDASNAEDAAHWNETLAYPLPVGSKDAAVLVTLLPGAYTVVVQGAGETTGVASLEIYETR